MFLFRKSKQEFQLELTTTLSLCKAIDSPRALTVYLLLSNKEYDQYLDLTIEPRNYDCPDKFRDDYLVTKVLSKSPNIPTLVDRRREAILAFRQSETQCKITNDKFWLTPDNKHPKWFFEMQVFIRNLLPQLSPKRLSIIERNFCHGPGATTGVRGRGVTAADKFEKQLHLTANLIPFYRSILGERWADAHHSACIVEGSRLTTVPKTSKTDRPICVEPTLNMYVQKGIGAYIRKRLRRFGLDLDVQATKNADLAKQAYDRDLATIDLKAASDSVAWVMLQRLLPFDWVHLLALSRSPKVLLEGEIVSLEKVSSMGNGYTFELESMIFFSLVRCIVPPTEWHNTGVFGDDIILPSKYARHLVEALNYLGFTVNESKSFLAGNFFESCGTDWFKGVQVRPFYLKGSSPGIPYPIQIANRLRKFSSQIYNGQWCDSRFKSIWLELVRISPSQWRKCRVPEILGDVGILSSFDERNANCVKRCSNGLEGLRVKVVAYKDCRRSYHSFGILLYALTSIGKNKIATYGKLPIRGYLGKSRTRWVTITRWPSGLEWDV